MKKVFQCERCDKLSPSDFVIFTPVNDWLTIFPDDRLIHLHFGEPTYAEAISVQEAEFIQQHILAWSKRFSQTAFFFVFDMSRSDSSELIADEAMHIYKELLLLPFIAGGALYGTTTSMRDIIALVAEDSPKPLTVVKTAADAEHVYQAWHVGQ